MSYLRIAIMTRSHPDKQVADESGEVEIRADQLVENGRLVLRNLLDQLRMELDELDYQERTEEEEEHAEVLSRSRCAARDGVGQRCTLRAGHQGAHA